MFIRITVCCVLLCVFSSATIAAPATSRSEKTENGVRVVVDDQGRAALAYEDIASVGAVDRKSTFQSGSAWSAKGPFGGDVECIGISPQDSSVVLAGIAPSTGPNGTLYRSSDGGATWSEVSSISGRSVDDIAFASDGTAYVGTIDGVWKSTDKGINWSQLPLGIGVNDQVFAVTLDFQNPGVIWAGVAGALGGQSQNVLRSSDGGQTWSDMTPNMSSVMSCSSIAVHPANSNKVYASFTGSFCCSAVWVSTDGGVTWSDRSAGLPTSSPASRIIHDGSRLLVCGGQLFGSQNFGVFESSDDGVTWNALHDASWPMLAISDIAVDPSTNQVLYAAATGSGLFKSIDGGQTWSFGIGGTSSLSVNGISIDPSGGAPVFIGCSSAAVWKSTDSTNFSASSNGIGALDAESVASNPFNPSEYAVAFQGLNDGGVYSTTDGGQNWTLEDVPPTRYNTVRFDPNGLLNALSDGPSTIAPEGLYRRSGTAWTALGPDQGSAFESELFGLAFSQPGGSTIIATGSDFGVAGHEPTVWRSTDSGSSWTKTYEGQSNFEEVVDVVIFDSPSQTMLASFVDYGSSQDGGVLRSTDSGQTWASSSTGLPSNARCSSISVARQLFPPLIYVGDEAFSGGGLFVSSDDGQSWTSTGFTGRVRRVLVHPEQEKRIYIASWSSPQVQESIDGGATFTPFDSGLADAGYGQNLWLAEDFGCDRLLLATTTGVWEASVACCPGFFYHYGTGCSGSGGFTPSFQMHGCPTPGGVVTVDIQNGLGGAPGFIFLGLNQASLSMGSGCSLNISPILPVVVPLSLSGSGAGNGSFLLTVPLPGTAAPGIVTLQAFFTDPGGAVGYSNTNGVEMDLQ